MTIQQRWYVPIEFESRVFAALADAVAQLVGRKVEIFCCSKPIDAILDRRNVGESLQNGNGLMDLEISARRLEDFFKERFPDYAFKSIVHINGDINLATVVTLICVLASSEKYERMYRNKFATDSSIDDVDGVSEQII